ncbi:Type IV secretory pathway, VirB4 components [Proteus mirabilis]|uniref:Type IV secretory pathway, VirB4 components n=1 Tax=Proteus mirabilis TaxID=584 RepID=A0A379GBV5_PROMI|nr:Type IV secretory pathway, VirB4 components [Proteus mirabilis]
MGFSLFRSRRKAQAVSAEKTDENKADKTVHRSTPAENAGLGRQPLSRPGKMTRADEQKIYHANPSFIDYLPWVEFLDEEQCLLLDDGCRSGRCMPLSRRRRKGALPAVCSKSGMRWRMRFRTVWMSMMITRGWCSFFVQDEDDVSVTLATLRDYILPAARGTAFTEAWLTEMARHLRGIARPEGLFKDTEVTGQPWRGQQRRTRMVVYRRLGNSYTDPMPPVAMLNQMCDRLVSSLGSAGVQCVRQDGRQVHQWLLRHFNPAPDWVDRETLYREGAYWPAAEEAPGTLPVLKDFAETLWFTPPRSDVENGVWWFDNLAHGVVNIEKLRKAPGPGHLTGEQKRGDKNINALMDLFPEGTMLSMTIVTQPQDTLEQEFTRLGKNSVGENTDSQRTRRDVETARGLLGHRHKLYRASLSLLLRAGSVEELNKKRVDLTATLLNAGLEPVKPEYDVAPLNGYLRALPMCFDPQTDKKHWYTRLTWVQHLAGLLPVTGRTSGTGHPGWSFFNRGGGVLTFDPQNKQDRTPECRICCYSVPPGPVNPPPYAHSYRS